MRHIASRHILAIVLICIFALGGIATLWWHSSLAQLTLRLATGPPLEGGQRAMAVVTQVFTEERPHVRLKRFQTPSMEASSNSMERGEADLAVVRSDIALPANGLTIAILRRDSIVVIVPAHSPIEHVRNFSGKTIALLKGASTEQDEHLERLLDIILGFYDIPATKVNRLFQSPAEAGAAIRKNQVAAIFAMGPAGPGPVANAIAAVTKATKAEPDLVGIEEAEAIANRHPGLESTEIAEGSFGGASPRPEDALTTLAVTYRLVAKASMPDFIASEVTRLLFLAKARLIPVTPLALQLEAPDTENKAALPVHPGAAAYFSGDQSSLLDNLESLFYLGWASIGVLGSGLVWMLGYWRGSRPAAGQEQIERLISILREAHSANAEKVATLEEEVDEIAAWSLGRRVANVVDTEQLNTLSVAIGQARHVLDKRRVRELKKP